MKILCRNSSGWKAKEKVGMMYSKIPACHLLQTSNHNGKAKISFSLIKKDE
jgi:hypothetical protein